MWQAEYKDNQQQLLYHFTYLRALVLQGFSSHMLLYIFRNVLMLPDEINCWYVSTSTDGKIKKIYIPFILHASDRN